MSNEASVAFTRSPYLLKGLCLSVACSFLATEIGKLAHDAEMRLFFLSSGYPIWLLYFVILAETLGSIGLFVEKTVVPAAIGLCILMVGAIYTHFSNGDPFSSSMEALHLLLLLVCVIGYQDLCRSFPKSFVEVLASTNTIGNANKMAADRSAVDPNLSRSVPTTGAYHHHSFIQSSPTFAAFSRSSTTTIS
ncbi:MAG: DoxX family protein [Pyrinomonadaceae bacterium]